MLSFVKDKAKLLIFSLFCALVAWGFWYVLGMNGFYVIGAVVIASYGERLYRKCKQKKGA